MAADEELMPPKKKEVSVLTKMIEQKLGRIRDFGEAIQQMKHGFG